MTGLQRMKKIGVSPAIAIDNHEDDQPLAAKDGKKKYPMTLSAGPVPDYIASRIKNMSTRALIAELEHITKKLDVVES